MKTEAFENGTEKKRHILSFSSASSVVLVRTTGENASKCMRFYSKMD